MKVTTGPDVGPESCNPAFHNDFRIETNIQKIIGATCFKWDKPRGCPGAGRAWRRCTGPGGLRNVGM